MKASSSLVRFVNKNQGVIEGLMEVASICSQYSARLETIDDLSLNDLEHPEKCIRKAKFDLIVICEILRAQRIGQAAQDRDVVYYKLIAKEPIDPINVIRHGIVHHDYLIEAPEKFAFYMAVLKEMTTLACLGDNILAAQAAPLTFDDVKKMAIYKKFKALHEQEKCKVAVAICQKLDASVAKKLLENFNYVLDNTPKELPEECKRSMVVFRRKYAPVLTAVAEIGEILNQTKNLYGKNNYKIYLNVGDNKLWLNTSVINAFIETKKCVHHFNSFNSHLDDTLAAMDFIRTSYAQAKRSGMRPG